MTQKLYQKDGALQNACHPEHKRRIFLRRSAKTFKRKILRHFVPQDDKMLSILQRVLLFSGTFFADPSIIFLQLADRVIPLKDLPLHKVEADFRYASVFVLLQLVKDDHRILRRAQR